MFSMVRNLRRGGLSFWVAIGLLWATGAIGAWASDATTTTLTVANTPISGGAMVTMTASVSDSASPMSAPVGMVYFYNGSVLLGRAQAHGGAATLTRPLPVGFYQITASYAGSAGFAASSSSIFPLAVSSSTLIPTTVSMSSVANSKTPTNYDLSIYVNSGLGAAPQGTISIQQGATTLATLDASTFATYNALNSNVKLAALQGVMAAAVADFNGDGYDEAFTLGPNMDQPNYVVYAMNASGAMTASAATSLSDSNAYFTSMESYFVGAASGDFNQDGLPDVAALNSNYMQRLLYPSTTSYSAVEILRSDMSSSSLSFKGCDELQLTELAAAENPTAVAVDDFNGDGFADVAVATSLGRVYVYTGTGRCGDFKTRAAGVTVSRQDVMDNITGLTSANLRRDGVSDLVLAGVAGSSGSTIVLINDGTGHFTPSASSVFEGVASGQTAIYGVSSAQYRKGARPNWVVASYLSSVAYGFSYNVATGAIVADYSAALPTNSQPIAAASLDVDFDGWPDPVALSPTTSQLNALWTDAGGVVRSASSPTIDSATFLASGHFARNAAEGLLVGNNSAPYYLQTLSARQTLKGTSSNVYVNGVGSQTVTVTFTPTDATQFSAASQQYVLQGSDTSITTLNFATTPSAPALNDTVELDVSAPYPSSWSAPTGVVTLADDSALKQNARTASLSGGVAKFNLGKLAVGSYTYYASYAPAAGSIYKYTGGAILCTVTVDKATPKITWATPSAVTFGDALSATQLNATADVAGDFSYTPGLGAVLAVGSQDLRVDFTPTDNANYKSTSAHVTLAVNKATPTIAWTPANLAFGVGLGSAQLNAVANVSGSYVYTPAMGAMLSVGPHMLHVDFTPEDTVNYANASADAQVVVGRSAATIAWATPAAIAYGTPLSAAQLNATSSVAGVFTYNHNAGEILPVGSNLLTVTFTPTDAANYDPASAQVYLTVNKATPTITWATPAAIAYGTPLSATQLSATANVAGAFVYNQKVGDVLAAGTHVLHADFTPTDATNYINASAEVSLTVNKATPTISWATPSKITYGTALSATQLNATADVAGSFVYAPAAGEVLEAGSRQLQALFTPSDAANYATTTGSVALTVDAAPLTLSANNASRAYGAANPTLTGTINGVVNNDAISVVYATSATSASPVGSYDITPTASGARIADYLVSAANGKLTVSQTTSVTSLSSSDSSILVGSSATLTATVTSATGGAATGSVNFYAGSTLAGSQPLNANGSAIFQLNGLAVGSYALRAEYVGDGNVSGSSSPNVSLTVASSGGTTTPDYSLSASPSNLTLRAGSSGSTTITLTPVGGYRGNIALSCSSLPSYASCSFSSNQLTAAGDNKASSSVLTISTSTTVVASARRPRAEAFGARLASILILGLAGLFGARRRRWLRWLALTAFVLSLAFLSGCGGGSASPTPQNKTYNTPAGNYTLVVTAAAGDGSTTTHNMNFTLTVTN